MAEQNAKDLYSQQIKEFLQEHKQEMIADICRLVRIDSSRTAAEPGLPYGRGAAAVLQEAASMLQDYDLLVTNYDNYVITADFGTLPPQLDILAHLDVVPGGDDWTATAPFEPLLVGDRLYGRGTCDDKGPAVAALYALRALKELKIPLRKNVRLILGSDEECGSSDLAYYYQREKEAPMSFTPDADFPVINIEKGNLKGTITAAYKTSDVLPYLYSLQAGIKNNVVPSRAQALVCGLAEAEVRRIADQVSLETGITYQVQPAAAEDIAACCAAARNGAAAQNQYCLQITALGKAAHGASPQDGNNALTGLLACLCRLPLAAAGAQPFVQQLLRLFPHGQYNGEALGVNHCDEISGCLTLALIILQIADGKINAVFDCRAPLCANDGNTTLVIAQKLQQAGLAMEETAMIPPHYVPADSPLVQALLQSYEKISGEPGQTIAIGGGTYVHELQNGVAFGCADRRVDNHMHGPDEFVLVEQLLLSAAVFADAIIRICG